MFDCPSFVDHFPTSKETIQPQGGAPQETSWRIIPFNHIYTPQPQWLDQTMGVPHLFVTPGPARWPTTLPPPRPRRSLRSSRPNSGAAPRSTPRSVRRLRSRRSESCRGPWGKSWEWSSVWKHGFVVIMFMVYSLRTPFSSWYINGLETW